MIFMQNVIQYYTYNCIMVLLKIKLGGQWKNPLALKLVSAFFYYFHQTISLKKLWKMLFISSKNIFSFWRCSKFCIFILPSFPPCQTLPLRMIEDKSYGLWRQQFSKSELNNTFCFIFSEGKKLHWKFSIDRVLNKKQFYGEKCP